MDGVIMGWGHSPFGRLDALSFDDLVAMVTPEALADAWVEAEEMQLATPPQLSLCPNMSGGAVNAAASILEPVTV